MAEVLPQIRLRADTQSQEATSTGETPRILPLRDATNSAGNGRAPAPESVEGETPSSLSGFSTKEQPATETILSDLLTLLFQHGK